MCIPPRTTIIEIIIPIIRSGNLLDHVSESMVADADSIPVWLKRFYHYKDILVIAIKEKQSEDNISFIKLELEFFKNALDFYEVEYE